MKIKTMSFCQGKGCLSHNNRDFIPKNVDASRMKDNITFVKEPIAEAYEKIFGEAIERYNQKQTRADRKITTGYFEHAFNHAPSRHVITSPDKRKSFYEDLVQIGDMHDSGCGTPDGELVSECLIEYARGFAERNPNFYIFNLCLHKDEATPHLHIDYIPVGHYKRGVDTQNGLSQALKEMGFTGIDAISKWRIKERKVLEQICNSRGIEIKEPEQSRGSFAVEEYKVYKDNINELQSQVSKESAQLEKIAKKKTEIKDVDKIESKPSMFGDKVTISVSDFNNLQSTAKTHIAYKKNNKKLNTEVAKLKEENQGLVAENFALKRKFASIPLKIENNRLQDKIDELENKLSRIYDFLDMFNLQERLNEFMKSFSKQKSKSNEHEIN